MAAPGGLEGTLEYFPLTDVFQLLASANRSGLLVVSGPTGKAYIYFRDGNPVHALMGETVGDEAVFATFLMRHGSFGFNPQIPPPKFKTIRFSGPGLLMEALRRLDESNVRQPAPPPPDEFDHQLRLADGHVQVGNVQAARAIYEQLLRARPGHAEVTRRLQHVAHFLGPVDRPAPGRLQPAAPAAAPAGVPREAGPVPPTRGAATPAPLAAARPAPETPQALEEGDLVVEIQVLETAIRSYESILKKDPRNAEIRSRLDEMVLYRRQLEEGAVR